MARWRALAAMLPLVAMQGLTAEGHLDGVGLLQVLVDVSSSPAEAASEVENPDPGTTMRAKRWGAMGQDGFSMSYPVTKQDVAAHKLASKRYSSGAKIGCVIGYLCFAAIIGRVYWSQGVKIVFFVLIFLISLAFMTIIIKHIYVEYDFRYPKFITAFHLLFSALAGFIVLMLRARSRGEALLVPSLWEFSSRILPISVCFGGAIGLTNSGLLTVSPLLAEILGTITPLAAVPFTLMMGMPFQLILLVPIMIVLVGAVIAVEPWTFTMSVKAGGVFMIVPGVVLRAAKTVLQQEVMTGELRDRLDEYALLAWSSITSAVLMFVWSAIGEKEEPWGELVNCDRRAALYGILVVSVLIAVIVNISHLWVTKVLGAVSSQLLGHTKAVLILLASIAFLGDQTSLAELVGFGLVLFGTFLYGVLQQKLFFFSSAKS